MISKKFVGDGLTYDDVLLVPSYSKVLPREVSIVSRFSRNITLNVPIVSAAMDTVTESKMAIAMAQEGGIGVLHKNMTIVEQADKVRTVKRAESGMIIDPVILKINSLVKDAKENMEQYKIGGIPIVDDNSKLLGIVTNRDLRFEKNNKRPITEVMTSKNLVTVNKGISLDSFMSLSTYRIEELRGSLLVVFSPAFISILTNAYYGGNIEVLKTTRQEFTATEERIIEMVNVDLMKQLKLSWKDLTPINFTNYILQGEIKNALSSLMRFVINSTFGLLGVIDLADKINIKKNDTDFDKTLERWGAEEGNFLVIPFIGPRSSRHFAGSIVDIVINPLNYFLKDEDSIIRITPTALYAVSARSGNMDTIDNLRETSIDYYSSLKSIYYQNRLTSQNENSEELIFDDFFESLENEN